MAGKAEEFTMRVDTDDAAIALVREVLAELDAAVTSRDEKAWSKAAERGIERLAWALLGRNIGSDIAALLLGSDGAGGAEHPELAAQVEQREWGEAVPVLRAEVERLRAVHERAVAAERLCVRLADFIVDQDVADRFDDLERYWREDVEAMRARLK